MIVLHYIGIAVGAIAGLFTGVWLAGKPIPHPHWPRKLPPPSEGL